MRIRFVKCHGSGNDFPLIDARAMVLDDAGWAAVARLLADRSGPVGGDGLLVLTDADETGVAFGMRMFNSDGSEAETCLNGLRCVARAGFEALGSEAATVALKTSRATVERAEPLAPGVCSITETAGPATLRIADWPLRVDGAMLVRQPIAQLSATLAFTAVAISNPHLVAFVDTIDEAELVRVGTACEAAPEWLPNRANVSFVEVRAADTLFVRTFERGVGLTDSCGSAMAASTYAGCLAGHVDFGADVTVLNRGGLVRARAEVDAMVTLTGNATWEWEGEITLDPTARTVSDLTVVQRHDEEVAAWAAVVAGARARS